MERVPAQAQWSPRTSPKIPWWLACLRVPSESWKEKRREIATESQRRREKKETPRLIGSVADRFSMILTIEEKQSLIDLANAARQRAYAPYSNYPVGAALRTKTGRMYTGVNVENAAYPHTMCAERVAIFKAISDGEKEFEVISVVTDNGGSPCGGCRQVMAEFALDMIVLMADGNGKLIKETTVGELLPEAFTPNHLNK